MNGTSPSANSVVSMRTGRTSRIRRTCLAILKNNATWYETATLAAHVQGATVAQVRQVLHRMADAGEIRRDDSLSVLMWRGCS